MKSLFSKGFEITFFIQNVRITQTKMFYCNNNNWLELSDARACPTVHEMYTLAMQMNTSPVSCRPGTSIPFSYMTFCYLDNKLGNYGYLHRLVLLILFVCL